MMNDEQVKLLQTLIKTKGAAVIRCAELVDEVKDLKYELTYWRNKYLGAKQ